MNAQRQAIQFIGLVVVSAGLSPLALSAPLFDSDEVLDVVLEAPIGDLSRQRHKKREFPGTFRYTDTSGLEHAFSVKVSPRGHSRLKLCDYPQLRITFDRDETSGTLFEGQHKLKLVRQCTRGRNGRDWLHLEFAVYRAYNVISDYSFRVRKLEVSYRETGSSRGGYKQPAFFLEADNNVAKRLNRERIRPPEVDPAQMAVVETTHSMLFQYLIGNTDFAVKRGGKGEGCCHNGRVIAEAGKQQDWIIVPYDFDYAGVINTEYALPGKGLPIRQVTKRLYRGFCWQNDVLPESVGLFNEKRTEIEAAFISSGISKRSASRVRRFIDRFYKTVNNPQELQEELMDKCRGRDSLPLRESLVSPGHVKAP